MYVLITGNVIALISSIIMVYTGAVKNKKKILYFQSLQIGLSVISNIILGGISGAIINAMGLIRNILCYKDKLRKKEKTFIILLSSILILRFNNLGLIGLLPLISNTAYIIFMNMKDLIKFKRLIIFTMIMWFIYDLIIQSYTSAIFDAMTILVNTVSIINLKNKNRLSSK